MRLVKLEVRNFRGFAQANREFGQQEIIKAQNKEGKSIFREAFKWVCGFDVNGFEPVIQPTNIRIGTPDKPITTEIIATVEKDGLIYTIKRKSEQKWKVNKDTQAVEFVGNVGKFYFDSESDCNAGVYKDKVASLFGCSYADLEIVIDIQFFNTDTTKFKWDNRRKWLFDKLDIDSVVKGLAYDYDLLRNDLLKGKDEVDLQKSLNAEKSSIKAEQERNLTLIEDKMKQLAVYQAIDFDGLKNKLAELQKEYEKLLLKSNKDNKNTIIAEMQDKLSKLQADYQKERNLIYIKESKLESEKSDIQKRIYSLTYSIDKERSNIDWANADIMDFEIKIAEFENKTFDEHAKVCKECGQQLQSEKIEALILNFERAKSNTILDLRTRVDNKRTEIQIATVKANTLTDALNRLQSQLKALNETIIDKSNLLDLEKQIGFNLNAIATTKMADVKESVAEKIEAIKTEMSAINKELGKQAIIEDIKSAIEMLKASSLKLTAQEADRLRKQLQLKEYVQAKIALVSEKVNSYFTGVTFRFFKENGANAENEFENTCECLVDGLSYRDCTSTGTKTIANIQTTIGLQKILGVSVPLWVDELAVVTSDIDCEGYQFIGLQATKGVKLENVLRVDKMYSINDCCVKGN